MTRTGSMVSVRAERIGKGTPIGVALLRGLGKSLVAEAPGPELSTTPDRGDAWPGIGKAAVLAAGVVLTWAAIIWGIAALMS